MFIMQLGMCTVQIKFINITKQFTFFVVPGNGQALLVMPDTMALNLIKLNIDSIQTIAAECKTNNEQEIHTSIKACTNTNTTQGGEDCKKSNASIDIK